jgi:hypothetical protein
MTQREVIEKWLSISSDRLKKSMDEKGIVDSQALKTSFQGRAISDDRVKLLYNLSGMFSDMGVGKGRKFSDAQKLSGKRGRRPKKWYSKSINYEIFQLSVALSNNAGNVLLSQVQENIPKKLDL